MKIQSTNWNVSNTENLYKNIKEKLNKKPEIEPPSQSKDIQAAKNPEGSTVTTHSVLTEKEIDTLRLLFGEEGSHREISFYGKHKPINIQSGFFLDMKG